MEKKQKVIFVRARKPLTVAEMKAAFSVEANHPLLRAIHQLLDGDIEDYTTISTDPQLLDSHGKLAGAIGGLDSLLDFRTKLVQAREASVQFSKAKGKA